MTNLKVGDKVRRVTESHWPEEYGVVGQVYEVLQMLGRNLEIIPGKGGATQSAFELVEEVMHYEVGKPCLEVQG